MPAELAVVVPIRSELATAETVPSRFEFIKALVLDGLTSAESRRAYARALNDFLSWCVREQRSPVLKATINQHRADLVARGMGSSSVNVRLAAIRKLIQEAADNGLVDPAIAAGARTVRGIKSRGVRSGNWLPNHEAERLLNAPGAATVKAKRDTAILAVLLGCGLRRTELAALEYRHVQQCEGRWVIVDMVGKGGRIRTVPMPAWAKHAIDTWSEAIGRDTGRVFMQLKKNGEPNGTTLTDSGVYLIARTYAAKTGVSIAPHDMRRTFAKLAHRGGAALEQIQLTLGHASIQTTERYLGVQQDLTDAPCDHIGIRLRTNKQ